jgi:hypothetical protein
MDNNSILNGFQYTFAIMLVLLVLVFWRVYFVHRPKINELQLEHESGLSTIEAMRGPPDNHGYHNRYLQQQSDFLATPGYNKGFAGIKQQRSGFFGGSEPPVFYDIGNIQADRAMRSKRGYKFGANQGQDGIVQNLEGGYSIVQNGDRGVLYDGDKVANTKYDHVDKGNYYFNRNAAEGEDKWQKCPVGQLTSADGYSCYIPEGMTDPLAITTSGFGRRDPFADIEDSVYGG